MEERNLQVEAFRAVRDYMQNLVDRGYSYSEARQLVSYVTGEAMNGVELKFNFMRNTEKHM